MVVLVNICGVWEIIGGGCVQEGDTVSIVVHEY